MRSPRYRPAGLLVNWRGERVMLDGGGTAAPRPPLAAWLVTDGQAELIAEIRRQGRRLGVAPVVRRWLAPGLSIRPMPVEHTSHATYGYLIDLAARRRVAWAPEFVRFPSWAAGVDVMFADAAGWQRPIRFAAGAGGHACVIDTAEQARRHGVRRLVFAHIGRPSIHAIDGGAQPPYGEWGVEGQVYRLVAGPAGGPLPTGPLPADVLPPPTIGDSWAVGRAGAG